MSQDNQLKTFISKLNDRNLQRKRESGITSYVLISVILFCIYKLYKNLYTYLEYLDKLDLYKALDILFLSSNFYIAIYFILESFTYKKKVFSNIKLIKYEKNDFNLLNFIIYILLFISPIIFLFLSLYNNYSKNPIRLEYYILMIILYIPTFGITIMQLFNKSEFKIKNLPENDLVYRLLMLFVSLVVIIPSLLFIHKIDIIEKLLFLKIILITYIVIILFEKYVIEDDLDKQNINLENFEYEIYLKNLSDDEIRNKLQEKYIGFLLDYWINNKKELVENYNKHRNKLVTVKENSITELNSKVDSIKYPIEYNERKKIIEENYNIGIEKSRKEINILKDEIKIILKNIEKLDKIEEQNINYLNNELSKIFKEE